MTIARKVRGISRRASCGACVYWQKAIDRSEEGYQDEGICRRHPPVAIGSADVDYEGDDATGLRGMLVAWPRTFTEDWCGEFVVHNDYAGRHKDDAEDANKGA